MSPRSTTEPATLLQAARINAGWKQSRVVAALLAQAKTDRIRVSATPSSLKTMLSRWENGEGRPDAVYTRLFCSVYGLDEDELGLTRTKSRAGSGPTVAPTLDAETVDYFHNVFQQHIRADNLMGPHHLVDVVRAQAALLDEILPQARDDIRNNLLLLACRYNEFTGWLYQDAGDPTNAMLYSDRAMDYALAINNPIEIAYLLMRKCNIANDFDAPARALGLADAALRQGTEISPRVRALILTQRARAFALKGERDDCARSLDTALHEVSRPDANSDDLANYCTPSYVQMQSATAWHTLGQSDRAIPVFEEALARWPGHLRRDQGVCLTRLAVAHAERGDKTNACRVGKRAAQTVRSATSARALRELRHLRQKLAPWRRDDDVSDLNQLIKALTRSV
jgi:tetratricopeptide (TPR) repeat protein